MAHFYKLMVVSVSSLFLWLLLQQLISSFVDADKVSLFIMIPGSIVAAGMLPFAKNYGKTSAFAFACFAYLAHGLIVGYTASIMYAYAILYGFSGAFIGLLFNMKRNTSFALASTVFVLFYDIITVWLMYQIGDAPIGVLISGQIPFTIQRLAITVFVCAIISPEIEKWILADVPFKEWA